MGDARLTSEESLRGFRAERRERERVLMRWCSCSPRRRSRRALLRYVSLPLSPRFRRLLLCRSSRALQLLHRAKPVSELRETVKSHTYTELCHHVGYTQENEWAETCECRLPLTLLLLSGR